MVFSQKLNNHRILKRLAKALIRLRIWAGWSEALLVAHTKLLEISCTGSYIEIDYKLITFVAYCEHWTGPCEHDCVISKSVLYQCVLFIKGLCCIRTITILCWSADNKILIQNAKSEWINICTCLKLSWFTVNRLRAKKGPAPPPP